MDAHVERQESAVEGAVVPVAVEVMEEGAGIEVSVPDAAVEAGFCVFVVPLHEGRFVGAEDGVHGGANGSIHGGVTDEAVAGALVGG